MIRFSWIEILPQDMRQNGPWPQRTFTMATNKKPTNGGAKTSSSKPVAKATVPTQPPTPSVPPATSVPTPTPVATPPANSVPPTVTSVTYGSRPPSFQIKKYWKIIGVVVVALCVFLSGLTLGGFFKKTTSETDKKNPPKQEKIDDPGKGKVANPNREFFSGVLVCPANEWSDVVYIRENLKWSFPLGVPYVYILDENEQEIPSDGIKGAEISGNRVNSIKFKYKVRKVVVIEQVPFEKKDTPVEKK